MEDYRYDSSEISDEDYSESDEEQEDPSDYCKGKHVLILAQSLVNLFCCIYNKEIVLKFKSFNSEFKALCNRSCVTV